MRCKVKLSRFTAVLSLFFVLIFSAYGQTPEETPPPLIQNDGEIINIDSRLVVVPVSVLDANGQPVIGLKPEDFRVAENKKPQEISEVSDAENVPLEIAILFDISATTNSMFEFEQETAIKFLQEVMRSEDRATIITVGDNPAIVQTRDTAGKSAIAIRSIIASKQQTAFYDSISAAAEYLQKNTPEGRRKVIVIISDGEDTNSDGVVRAIWNAERKLVDGNLSGQELRNIRVKAREAAKVKEQGKVLKSLQNADTVFYSVNPAGSSYKLNKISVFGQENMEKFAVETGGTAFLPKFLPIDITDNFQREANIRRNTATLEGIFRQLANELRAQYLLQYYSDGEFPVNQYVNLNVGLKNPQNFRLRARQGYFVKKQ